MTTTTEDVTKSIVKNTMKLAPLYPKTTEVIPKKKKKKNHNGKQRMFSETIGVEDNDNYKKFKKKERLIFNTSNSKYFVIRFTAKSLFNFKLSYKN